MERHKREGDVKKYKVGYMKIRIVEKDNSATIGKVAQKKSNYDKIKRQKKYN